MKKKLEKVGVVGGGLVGGGGVVELSADGLLVAGGLLALQLFEEL